MDAVILLAETLSFPLGEEKRAGFVVRGVGDPQRLGGHITCLVDLCSWLVAVFHLNLDRSVVWLLCRNDDREKAITGDIARVTEVASEKAFRSIRNLVKRVIEKGFSREEVGEERTKALEVLRPFFQPAAPEVTEEIEKALRTFFRKNRSKEAQFVHDVGKVLDVHVYLWYLRNGHAKPSEDNIRNFMEGLRRGLVNPTAKLYWRRVKERYMDLLLPVYQTRRRVLAQ